MHAYFDEWCQSKKNYCTIKKSHSMRIIDEIVNIVLDEISVDHCYSYIGVSFSFSHIKNTMAETNRSNDDSFVLVKSHRKQKRSKSNKPTIKPILSINSTERGKEAEDHLIK